jgi:hypothetical protein
MSYISKEDEQTMLSITREERLSDCKTMFMPGNAEMIALAENNMAPDKPFKYGLIKDGDERSMRRFMSARRVAAFVWVNEAPLPSPVKGNSRFTETFAARGPFDEHGRSLRDFGLQNRLFCYPVSYMIYIRAFDSVVPPVRERINRRPVDILSGQDKSAAYARL